QFSIAGFCARVAAAAGRPVVPANLTFTQPAPRSYQAFVETFGTRRIEFGAPATTFTLREKDLDMPMPGADPRLARILRRYAATLPRPVPAVSRRLAISTRSLQRKLAEHGTSWRAELEAARRFRAQRAFQNGAPNASYLAYELGYADPRSLRRALRRWDKRTSS